MTRYVTPFFQISRPFFVKVDGLQAAGQVWKRGERFNWERLGVPVDKLQSLFNQDFIHHNEELEEKVAQQINVGDGLEELSIDQLHTLVKNINAKVKADSADSTRFITRACKQSNIKAKQIGLLRGWRLNYGHLE